MLSPGSGARVLAVTSIPVRIMNLAQSESSEKRLVSRISEKTWGN